MAKGLTVSSLDTSSLKDPLSEWAHGLNLYESSIYGTKMSQNFLNQFILFDSSNLCYDKTDP